MYKLIILEDVYLYFEKTFLYLKYNDYNIEYVNKIETMFFNRVKELKEFPYSCPFFEATKYHYLLIDNKHIFIYRIKEEEKEIIFLRAFSKKQNIYIK